MKFVLDTMLGHLVFWLRLLGYDTVYLRDTEDDGVLMFSKTEGRVLVTRDKQLAAESAKHGLKVVLLNSVETVDALRKIAEETGVELRFNPEKSRCSSCNAKLTKLEGHRPRWLCENCGKTFWVGRHWRNISKVLRVLEEETDG